MKVLHLISDLRPGGAWRQLSLLAAHLDRANFDCRVCVLGAAGPLAQPLREAGIAVDSLNGRHGFDPQLWRGLHRLLSEFQPDLLHLWKPGTLGAFRLYQVATGLRHRYPIVLSRPFPAPQRRRPRRQDLSLLERWLVRHVHRLAVTTPTEEAFGRLAGVKPQRLARLPLAVLPRPAPPRSLPVPPQAPCLACVGPLEPHKGFYDAIWAFDILRYLYPDLHLLLAGTGSDVPRLARFVVNIRGQGQVHFLGECAEVESVLARADVVWVPSWTAGGSQVALEAMALGKPVVAAQVPDLTAVVPDGQAGLLFAPQDKAGLSRQTRRLLDDPALRRRLGEAGPGHVARHFSVAALTAAAAELYTAVHARRPQLPA